MFILSTRIRANNTFSSIRPSFSIIKINNCHHNHRLFYIKKFCSWSFGQTVAFINGIMTLFGVFFYMDVMCCSNPEVCCASHCIARLVESFSLPILLHSRPVVFIGKSTIYRLERGIHGKESSTPKIESK